eukprot:2390290-Amphidinium_carterae.1
MPSEALENAIVVSSVVHCTPELQQSEQFLDPVLLCLPMPHLTMSRRLRIVTREHDTNEWRHHLEESAVHIRDGMVCFSARHFCDYGIEVEKLDGTKANSFTIKPFLLPRVADGSVTVKCLIFASNCTKCQQSA